VALAVVVAGVSMWAAPAGASGADSEWQFVERINELRADLGIVPLTQDAQLTAVARRWSVTMVDSNRLFHNMALPRWVNGWVKLGENVGVGVSIDALVNAFEASPPHLEHLVDPAYTLVGVGVIEARGQLWVTEEFERPGSLAPTVVRPAMRPARAFAVATHGQVSADTQPRVVVPIVVRLFSRLRAWATGVAEGVGTKTK
jgi:hypothetical protein